MIRIRDIERITNANIRLTLDNGNEVYAQERCTRFTLRNDDGSIKEATCFWSDDYEQRKYSYYINDIEVEKDQMEELLLKSQAYEFVHDVLVEESTGYCDVLTDEKDVELRGLLLEKLCKDNIRKDYIIRNALLETVLEQQFIDMDNNVGNEAIYKLCAFIEITTDKSALEDVDTWDSVEKIKLEIGNKIRGVYAKFG